MLLMASDRRQITPYNPIRELYQKYRELCQLTRNTAFWCGTTDVWNDVDQEDRQAAFHFRSAEKSKSTTRPGEKSVSAENSL